MANDRFRLAFAQVLNASVIQQFEALQIPPHTATQTDWPYLLFCASILADSDREDCQDMALRIAQSCISTRESDTLERESAGVVLDTLGNRLALSLSEEREPVRPNLSSRLGVMGRVQWARRFLENSIDLSDGRVIPINRFQRKFWQSVDQALWTSVSAPTSAGKSFIVLQWIVEFFRKRPKAIVIYLVSTRALIHQVETDFRAARNESHLSSVAVFSIPIRTALRENVGNFFVFTQERLHIFLSAFEVIPDVDLIIVDEAQKVGDRQRGVLLQEVIERVVRDRASAKIIFASPQAENPEALLSDAPHDSNAQSIISNEIMVNQNLLWVTQVVGDPQYWTASLCLPGELRPLGEFELRFSPTSVRKRLPFVAHALTPTEGGSLVYVDGAADAEKAAELLYDLSDDISESASAQALEDLADLVRNAIHDRYSLARVLSRGIAFHYGNMPLLVRNEVERCFKEGHIKFLVCTSTLIEGVNLPCRNIFVRGPQKGRGQPMNEADFWNLAGRAGRWGRGFQGNIVCVDATNANVWRAGCPQVRRRYRIERTTDKILDNSSALVAFIRDGTPRDQVRARPGLEYMA